MPSSVPKTLYRYRTFDAVTLDSLCRDQLFFANPISFNDPLDCKPTIKNDSSPEALRELLRIMIYRRVSAETLTSLSNAHIEGANATKYALKSASTVASRELSEIAYHATNPEYEVSKEQAEVRLLTNEIRKELLRFYENGVCCFSSVYNSPLLWSHYGDQHKGICIGYDLNRKPRPIPRRVDYGGSRIIQTSKIAKALINEEPEAKEELDRNVLMLKAPGWKYEREWRLIGKRGLQDSCLRMKDVTFGMRCPEAVMHAVICALDQRDEEIKFYEISPHEGSFRLRRSLVCRTEIAHFLPQTACSGEEAFPESSDVEVGLSK